MTFLPDYCFCFVFICQLQILPYFFFFFPSVTLLNQMVSFVSLLHLLESFPLLKHLSSKQHWWLHFPLPPFTCITPIGWHHATETYHYPLSFAFLTTEDGTDMLSVRNYHFLLCYYPEKQSSQSYLFTVYLTTLSQLRLYSMKYFIWYLGLINWEGHTRKWLWCNLGYYSDTWHKGVRESHRRNSQESQSELWIPWTWSSSGTHSNVTFGRKMFVVSIKVLWSV